MKSLLLLVVLLLPSVTFATAQFPDELLYNGKLAGVFSTPLEPYFARNERPKWLTETSTACWRGYVASWEIRDSRLYLTKIRREVYEAQRDTYVVRDITKKIFPHATLPIKAVWFSGVIRLPQGKQLEYIHMGFESIYEEDHLLEFESGTLKKIRIVRNGPKRVVNPGKNK